MNWISTSDKLPLDTRGETGLWLCDRFGNVFEGGYQTYPPEDSDDAHFFFDAAGYDIDVRISFWTLQPEDLRLPPLPPAYESYPPRMLEAA